MFSGPTTPDYFHVPTRNDSIHRTPGRTATEFWQHHAVITRHNIRIVPVFAAIIEDLTLSDPDVIDKLCDITFPRLRTLRLQNLDRFPRHMSIPRLAALQLESCSMKLLSCLTDTIKWWISGSIFSDALRTLQIINHRVPLQDVDMLMLSNRCHQLRHVDLTHSCQMISDWGILYIAFSNRLLEELVLVSALTTSRALAFLNDYCPNARMIEHHQEPATVHTQAPS